MRKGEYIYYEWFFYHVENGERIELHECVMWNDLDKGDIEDWRNHDCKTREGEPVPNCKGEFVLVRRRWGALLGDLGWNTWDEELLRHDGTLPSHFNLSDHDLETVMFDDNGEILPREITLDRLGYTRIPKYIHKHLEKIRSK